MRVPSYTVTQEFGDNPREDLPGGHTGIDLDVPTGTKVYLHPDFLIIVRGHLEALGYYLVLEYPGGKYIHLYHLTSGFRRADGVGIYVESGASGKHPVTGEPYAPHLHLGVSKDGVYLNPRDYFNL